MNSNVDELWQMSPSAFNEWRAKNDLPHLFTYLKTILPSFDTWLEQLPFGMDVVLRVVPSGALFRGEKKVVIKKNDIVKNISQFECFEGSPEEAKLWWKKRYENVEIVGEIEPYFKWAKRTLGRKRFFIWDKINNQISDEFIRGGCRGRNENGCTTHAYLFRDFALLKMGQVILDRKSGLGYKNLDFCDLDFTTIVGDGHAYASVWKTISYSSFRCLSIENANVFFYTFYHCWMDKIEVKKSKIQDFYFDGTDVEELNLSESYVFRMEFRDSNITPLIQSTELREVKFEPKKGVPAATIATTYRLLRCAFQSNGLRQEASNCYYHERIFERKSYFYPDAIIPQTFSGIPYRGKLSIVLDLYNRGYFKKNDLFRQGMKVLISKIKFYIIPKYLFSLLRFRLKWISSYVEYILWGYGERPSRIIVAALFSIFIYAGAYSWIDWVDDRGEFYMQTMSNSIYFSVVTFTTLGYGDITPKTQILKVLAGSEALWGAFIIGLIVAGFSNKSRY